MDSVKTIINKQKQFIKYFITGVTAFLLDIASLFVLKEYCGLSAVVAVMLNQVFILATIFIVNKYWSFESKNSKTDEARRYFVVAAINYVFSITWIYLMADILGVYYLLARFLNISLAVTWNFFLYKNWVYKQSENDDR